MKSTVYLLNDVTDRKFIVLYIVKLNVSNCEYINVLCTITMTYSKKHDTCIILVMHLELLILQAR